MAIAVHTSKMTTEVLGDDRVTGLRFKDGTELACDLVIVAAGIRPNSEIAIRAGLTVERAIVVNDHMQSVDDMNVYVVGECAQHRGKLYGLVAPLWDQAKVFAEHITHTNRDAAYHGTKLATSSRSPASTSPRWASPSRATNATRWCSSPKPGAAPTRS